MPVVTDQEPIQGLEATRIKITFRNMTSDALEELPALGDIQVYTVTATCTSWGIEEMADGEKRRFARMKVTDLIAQGPPSKPDAGPALFSVDDRDDDDQDDQ